MGKTCEHYRQQQWDSEPAQLLPCATPGCHFGTRDLALKLPGNAGEVTTMVRDLQDLGRHSKQAPDWLWVALHTRPLAKERTA